MDVPQQNITLLVQICWRLICSLWPFKVWGCSGSTSKAESVTKYQSKFEKLSNCTKGLTKSFLISCFVSRLQPTLRHDVQISRPKSMVDVIWLARMYEDKLNDSNAYKPQFSSSTSSRNSILFSKPLIT